ncbi:phosphatases II [Calocera viscosa TUFC12733]|uniref:Phosphatases II n=1 Tax=Calocera viscosa (strain TUFC12733) TaxID=1330018 RepID=A0A167LKE1_CALVF|nr:phosphatases II [Calocera viscosa TUFC12733]
MDTPGLRMDAIKVAKVDNVVYRGNDGPATGCLHLTAHHLIFTDSSSQSEKWVPYPLISLVTRLPQTLTGSSPLALRCRTFDSFVLFFPREESAADVFESVRELTVTSSISSMYAFFYRPNPPFDVSDGWGLYSPREEFARMGVGSRTKAWRFTDINKDYSFCPTYAARLVVPARISDTVLTHAAKYRSKARIPALTYHHWANFATITRSSQPMVGLTNSRSIQDEKLIEAIFQSHLNPTSAFGGEVKPKPGQPVVYGATATNLIIDARPTTNAMANVAKGAGTEKMEHYREGKKAYLGIDNIHVMRDSLARVVDCLREADMLASSLQAGENGQSGVVLLDRHALRKSGWLRHISAILDGALLIVRNVHVNSSHVLVHCSDGWDRTAQLASIAELCLDPFYRTFRGFQILVEKDWLAFGHRFADRCGHLSSEKFFITASGDVGTAPGGADAAQAFFASVQKQFTGQGHLKETSPVFHQFLECVRQIQRQYPTRFEFNELFLQKLHYHLYSCQFGSFLFNNEKDRRTAGPEQSKAPWERTYSIWDFFNDSRNKPEYLNPEYDGSLDDPARREPGADMGVLLPNPRDVRFWYQLYGRSDEEMNGRIVVNQAVGAEFLGPVENSFEDPVLPDESESDLTSLAASSESISRTSTPSLPTMQPEPVRSLPAADSAVSMHGQSQTGSLPDLVHGQGTQNFPLPRTRTPQPQPRGGLQDVFAESPGTAMRSLWASVSSGARTAASAAQAAYGGVAKEISRNLASGPLEGEGELAERTAPTYTPYQHRAGASRTAPPIGVDQNPWSDPISARPPPQVPGSSHEGEPQVSAFASLSINDPTIALPSRLPRTPTQDSATFSTRAAHSVIRPSSQVDDSCVTVGPIGAPPAPISISEPVIAPAATEDNGNTSLSAGYDPLGVWANG